MGVKREETGGVGRTQAGDRQDTTISLLLPLRLRSRPSYDTLVGAWCRVLCARLHGRTRARYIRRHESDHEIEMGCALPLRLGSGTDAWNAQRLVQPRHIVRYVRAISL